MRARKRGGHRGGCPRFAGNEDGDVMVFLPYAFAVSATGKDVATNLHHHWRLRDAKAGPRTRR